MNETIYLLDEYPTKHVGRLLHTLFRASDTNTVTRFIYKRPCNLDFAGKRFGFKRPCNLDFPRLQTTGPLSILFSHYSMTIYFNIVLTPHCDYFNFREYLMHNICVLFLTLISPRCLLHSAVPIALPRRCPKRPLQLAPYPWLDVQRPLHRAHHLLPLHGSTRPPSLQSQRKSRRSGNHGGHNVHMRRLGRELPDGTSHQLLHIDPTHLHMGRNSPMVPLPLSIRSLVTYPFHHCL